MSVRLAVRHPELVDAVVLAAGTVQAFSAVHAGRVGHLLGRPATIVATFFEVLTAGLPVPAFLRRQVIRRPLLRPSRGTHRRRAERDGALREGRTPGP